MNDAKNEVVYDFEKNPTYNEKNISERIGITPHNTPGIF